MGLLLLRQCGSFSKLVHLARSTPPSLVAEALKGYDDDVCQCFSECTTIDTTDKAWLQAQLSLSRGGLGLRSLSHHSSAAYIASLSASGQGFTDDRHLNHSIQLYNAILSTSDSISAIDITDSVHGQKVLSSKLEDHQFTELCPMPDKARLHSISSPHASAWLSVIPSPGSQSHLERNEFQIALKWWLGIGVSEGSTCVYCPNHSLDHLGHHSLTCKRGGDVVTRHKRLRDVLVEYCHLAHVGCQVEMGSGWGSEKSRTRPADVLIPNWSLGKPVAFDLTVTSPLNAEIISEASVTAGSAAYAAEQRKHVANDPKCNELGWVCIPLAVELYGCWGSEARQTLSRLGSRLACQLRCSKSQAIIRLYGNLSITLVRANARALLARFAGCKDGPGDVFTFVYIIIAL